MIPDSWHALLQNPEEAERTYTRLTHGFHWEDEHAEAKLLNRLNAILRYAFATGGAVSASVFKNELYGHLGDISRPSLHSPTLKLSPEQWTEHFVEEFDTDYYELMLSARSRTSGVKDYDRHDLVSRPPDRPPESKPMPADVPHVVNAPVERIVSSIQKQLRDPYLVTCLKELYGYRCQFCGTSIPMGRGMGWYSEAHHIRPLGVPHNGTDSADNMLIVCPNHHKMLDYGAIVIDLSSLALFKHDVSTANVRYHNEELQNVA